MSPRRLSFEEVRDSLFAVTQDLDVTFGGRPVPLFNQPFTKRRTVYGEIDREYVPNLLRAFDFANPDLHVAERSDTTVPQQSLFFLNHPLPLERARVLAAQVADAGSPAEKVTRMFQQVYQHEPTAKQVEQALAFVAAVETEPVVESKSPWSYGYAEFEKNRVVNFKPLATFNGEAWQAGGAWPDPTLGSMKLTADGGHADEKHVVVRRWTSPVNGIVSIASKLQHKSKDGDGVRGIVISTRDGKLAAADAFKTSAELNVKIVEVRIGDTIDFVVDHRKTIDHDEFLWAPVITENNTPRTWDAKKEFRGPVKPLTPWEQLAQVLFMANEFSFVD